MSMKPPTRRRCRSRRPGRCACSRLLEEAGNVTDIVTPSGVGDRGHRCLCPSGEPRRVRKAEELAQYELNGVWAVTEK